MSKTPSLLIVLTAYVTSSLPKGALTSLSLLLRLLLENYREISKKYPEIYFQQILGKFLEEIRKVTKIEKFEISSLHSQKSLFFFLLHAFFLEVRLSIPTLFPQLP